MNEIAERYDMRPVWDSLTVLDQLSRENKDDLLMYDGHSY